MFQLLSIPCLSRSHEDFAGVAFSNTIRIDFATSRSLRLEFRESLCVGRGEQRSLSATADKVWGLQHEAKNGWFNYNVPFQVSVNKQCSGLEQSCADKSDLQFSLDSEPSTTFTQIETKVDGKKCFLKREVWKAATEKVGKFPVTVTCSCSNDEPKFLQSELFDYKLKCHAHEWCGIDFLQRGKSAFQFIC